MLSLQPTHRKCKEESEELIWGGWLCEGATANLHTVTQMGVEVWAGRTMSWVGEWGIACSLFNLF